MTMAAAHGMQSIAMPLIGHGLAGWPAKLAAQIHVEQVVQFFKASTAACSVKEVQFVDLDDEAIAALQEELAAEGQPSSPALLPLSSSLPLGADDIKVDPQVALIGACVPNDGFQSHMHHIHCLDTKAWLDNIEKSMDFKQSSSKPPAHNACDLEVLSALLEYSIDVNSADNQGCTALHHAAANGSLDALKLLCHAGGNVNAADAMGRTPLHHAASASAYTVAKLLLLHGSQPTVEDSWGLTPAFPYSKEQVNSTLLTLAAELKSERHEAQGVLAALEEPERVGALSMPSNDCRFSPTQSSLSTRQLTELRASWPKEQRELMQEADGMLLTVMLIKEDCALQAHDNQQRLINRAQFYQKQLSELSSKLRFA
ncbi:TPA: hypothetical protein ACH3X3_008408 [Trebouxia sp. C0006]